ncbi:hypothetical protein JKP88DRAFT_244901 [Tribonema minus]|uniref:Uncharacterized protein n=1 Tax=Tribonema minus TaxID=303371 RepID=A0A836CHM7_9STRA|nr:hypothetical protein JKP88DRAFT_244901 [Tribonema minus]
MNDSAKYNYYGSSKQGGGGGFGADAGGFTGYGGDYAGLQDSSTANNTSNATNTQTPVIKMSAFDEGDKSKVTIAVNSGDRDKLLYPSPNNCVLDVPDTLVDIKGIRLMNVEMPHTDYIVSGSRLYVSEFQSGSWQPFYVAVSSGNYSVDEFVDALNYSFNSPVAIGSQNASLLNRYSVQRSSAFGKVGVRSTQKVPYSLHFRSTNVAIVGAQTVANADGSVSKTMIQVTITDAQPYPFSPGAACSMVLGGKFGSQIVVVETVVGSRLTVRSVMAMSTVTTATVSGMSRPAKVSTRGDLSSIIGTLGVGATIPVSTSANMEPLSKPQPGFDNLGTIMGFPTSQDTWAPTVGTSVVLGLQSPFAQSDGAMVVVTEHPHFANIGDIVNISGSNTFFDQAWHEVVAVQDETHLTLKGRMDAFMDYMNFTDATTGVDAQVYVLSVHSTSPYFRLMEWLASLKPKFVSAGDNAFTVGYEVASGFTIDTADYVDRKVVFDASDYDSLLHPMYEWQLAEGQIISFDSVDGANFTNRMLVKVNYPTWLLPGKGCTLTLVNNGTGVYSPTDQYSPMLTIAPSRFDMSIGHRYLYLQILINDQAVGNIHVANLPGTTLFARLPLVGGSDAISFLNKDFVNAITKLDVNIPKIRNMRFKLFAANGQFYDTKQIEWSAALQFDVATTS